MHDFVLLRGFSHPIHLLPPEEHLLSRMWAVSTRDSLISTSFAWLGHGTFLRRDVVDEFLLKMKRLQMSPEEHKMADNYFSVFYGRVAEVWFDHSTPLGGGHPFTVGEEGDARNDLHIVSNLLHIQTYVYAV